LKLFSAPLTSLRELNISNSTIYINGSTVPFARLRELQLHISYLVDEDGNDLVDEYGNDVNLDLARSLFSPAQFPALCLLTIDDLGVEDDHTRFNLLLPQLSDVELCLILLSVVTIQLPLCTSLKTLRLRIGDNERHTALLPFFNALRGLNLEDFRYFDWSDREPEASLRDARRIMAIVEEMETLKKLSLGIGQINIIFRTKRKWIKFKEGVRKLCQENKVEMVRYAYDRTYERDELTWVDNMSD
jgi:hypothetical protein